jgi:hypothetical protein
VARNAGSHDLRRGVPWWTPLLGLAALAGVVAAVAAAGGEDTSGERGGTRSVLGVQHVSTRAAAEETAAPAPTTTAAASTGLRPGSHAAEHSVRILEVVGTRIFWVGRDRAHSVLVHLQGPGTRWAVRPGQRVTFTATVARNRPGDAAAWGLTRAEGRDRYDRRGTHFEVYGLRIRFLCVLHCAT